jgi:isocitrate lyase
MSAAYLDSEEQQFQAEVAEVKQWWSDSRWRYTKRPFTAEQIVTKRGNLKQTYAGNQQSKKLWNILEGRFKVRLECFNLHKSDVLNN